MRDRAYAAGTLKTTPQQTVLYQSSSIVIQPVNPAGVYVSLYNPYIVSGARRCPFAQPTMLLRRMRCAAASILVFTAMHVVQVSEENARTAESQPSVAVRLYVSAQAQAFPRFFAVNRNWHRIRTRMAKQRRGTHLIADIAKVSRGTVDRALHGRGGVNEATRQRILQIAREIGYRPNLAARALSANRATAKIGVCMPREIHFFYDQLWSGVLEEAERVSQFGVEFLNRPVQNLGEGDAKAFKELMASGVDGIILTAGNPKNLTPLINKAETKGVRVVCVDTDASESHRSSVVYVEPYLSGCVAGELLGKLVPPGSKVAVVAGMLMAEDHRRKAEGFSETFRIHCLGGKIAAVIEGHEDEYESFQKTLDLLRRVPELAGIYVNTVNCLPVCRALGAGNLEGKVKLITSDLFAEMAPYFKKGTIAASIYHQPHRQGQIAVRLMADNLISKVNFPPTVRLSPTVVISSNLHLFREMRPNEPKPTGVPTAAGLTHPSDT
jgi:LacI family transcriptional regulator